MYVELLNLLIVGIFLLNNGDILGHALATTIQQLDAIMGAVAFLLKY
jgi:hypothetical protein